MLIDETAAVASQGYRLTRIYRTSARHTVRVLAVRDLRGRHSFAKAEPRNTELSWTMLLEEPPAR